MARVRNAPNGSQCAAPEFVGTEGDHELILATLSRLQTPGLLLTLKTLLRIEEAEGASIGGQFLGLLRQPDVSIAIRTIVGYLVRQQRRVLAQGAPSPSSAPESGLATVKMVAVKKLTEKICAEGREQRPAAAPEGGTTSPDSEVALSDGRFIQHAFEIIFDRGCRAHELSDFQLRLHRKEMSRLTLIAHLCAESLKEADAERANEARHDGRSFDVMGTGERVTQAHWQARAAQLKPVDQDTGHSRFALKAGRRLAISAIASLYKGGRFIQRFLDNITNQTCFDEYAELIIIDANSPDSESQVIKSYQARHRNIKYIRVDQRIGIYEAWNIGVAEARGEYLTCTNLDDLRRHDSLELQAATLETLPFVDVVYQDFFYSFDPVLTFEEVARYGYRSNLPLVTRRSLLSYNPPHNAPMWRRRLHDELGGFDTSYQSAGDYDFWMRCAAAGKIFYKLNDPHVVYYQNPEGISTRPGTRGFEETRSVHRRRDRELLSELLVMPFTEFCHRHLPDLPPQLDDGSQDRARHCQRALRRCALERKYRRPTVGVAA
jgi:glycosyltransferase involved in cell wall biosynthesis